MCGDIEYSLFCEEEFVGSPWKEVHHGSAFDSLQKSVECGYMPPVFLEDEETIAILLDKEARFMPGPNYLNFLLSTDLCDARCRGVPWMIKAGVHFNFHASTVCLAVNYLDRFLSKNLDKIWKSWMIELLSVGCLSLAAKQEEVSVPLLQDFQVEGVEYTFNSATIQRMELTILSTLEWRMSSVTAFAYTETMVQHLDLSFNLQTYLHARITELLLQSLREVEFLEYRPSLLALSSIYCALEELVPLQADLHKAKLSKFIQLEKKKLESCYQNMQELVVDPLCPMLSSSRVNRDPKSPPSPVRVTEIADPGHLPNGTDISKYIHDIETYIQKRANSVHTIPLSSRKHTRKRKKVTEPGHC